MDEYTQARCCAAENAALLFCLKEQPDTPHDSVHPEHGKVEDLLLFLGKDDAFQVNTVPSWQI